MPDVLVVIQLLDELSAKVTADGESELAEFTEFSQWCAVERRGKDDAIASSKRSINDLTATAESSRAAVDQLQTKVAEVPAGSGRVGGRKRTL